MVNVVPSRLRGIRSRIGRLGIPADPHPTVLVRLHSAHGYVTPKDLLAGRQSEIWAERDRKLEAACGQRRLRRAGRATLKAVPRPFCRQGRLLAPPPEPAGVVKGAELPVCGRTLDGAEDSRILALAGWSVSATSPNRRHVQAEPVQSGGETEIGPVVPDQMENF